jgi:FkbM family methyltransferase
VGRLRGKVASGVRRLGYEVVRLAPPTEARRARAVLLADLGIETVVDVGANDGAFAHELRLDGYRGRIISFEPGAEAFKRLQARCADDPNWECRKVALGATDGVSTINVAANSSSSSLLPMTAVHEQSAPGSGYIGVETVELARLDSLQRLLGLDTTRLFIKVDVQGYELEVLKGAVLTLTDALALESELSFVELYEDQPLFNDVVSSLREAGFVMTGIEEVHFDARTGELLQVNGTFRRPVRLT